MFWKDEKPPVYAVPDDIVDVAFRIDSAVLPLDHAYALREAVAAKMPWIREEPGAGIHPIHGAESGNGWERPSDPEVDVLHLPRRTRLRLRVPNTRVPDARKLTGATLEVGGYAVAVGTADVRLLQPAATMFARHVVTGDFGSENEFLSWAADTLAAGGITARKLVCGRTHELRLPSGRLALRSLMIADLTQEESIRVQQDGLGEHRALGCGIFVPCKGITAVRTDPDG